MNQDPHCDLLIRNAYVITVDARRRVFSPGAVAVRGNTLVAVGPERDVVGKMRAARTIDAEGAVLHPGFIDAHNHVVGAGCRGVFANDADDPVSGVNYAAWKADVSSDDEAAAATLTALQLLHAGYTGVVEAGTVFDPTEVAAAVETAGIRTCLAAPYLWDDITVMQHLGSLESEALFTRAPADFERCVAELGSELHRNDDSDGRIHGFVCLYGLGTASDELERRAKTLAREHDVVLHQHEAYEPASSTAQTERLGHSNRASGLARRAGRPLHARAHEHPDRRGRRHRCAARMLGGVVPRGLSRDGACRQGRLPDAGAPAPWSQRHTGQRPGRICTAWLSESSQ